MNNLKKTKWLKQTMKDEQKELRAQQIAEKIRIKEQKFAEWLQQKLSVYTRRSQLCCLTLLLVTGLIYASLLFTGKVIQQEKIKVKRSDSPPESLQRDSLNQLEQIYHIFKTQKNETEKHLP